MTAIYDKIRAALEVHLNSTPNLPPVAWENVDYSPATDAPFIKARLQPTSRRPSVKGSDPRHRYQGLYTLLCHFPEGKGPSANEDLVNTLIDRFNSTVDIPLDGVVVRIEYSEAQSSYSKTPWYVTPVTIAWFCYQ